MIKKKNLWYMIKSWEKRFCSSSFNYSILQLQHNEKSGNHGTNFGEKQQGKNNNPKGSRGGDPCKANTPCWASLPWTNSSESVEAVWQGGGGRGGGGQRRREGSCPGVLTCLHWLGLFRPGVKGRPVADVLIPSSVGHLYTVILSTLLCSTPQ